MIDVGTGEAELLLEGGFARPEWSPDGRSVAYVTTDGDELVVGELDLATGELVDVGPGDFPRWTPDGASLLVTRDGSIVRLDLSDATDVNAVTAGCCAAVTADGHLVLTRFS